MTAPTPTQPASTARRRSLALHGLWAGLTLGVNRLDRVARRRGAPSGAVLPVVVVSWYALLLGLERRRPFRAEWRPPMTETRTDAGFWATTTAAALTGQATGAALVRRVRRRRGSSGSAGTGIRRLGVGGGVVASLLTSDLVHYWLHRVGHEWGPAWRFHSVHHSPERLHILNATRFHPVEQYVEGVLEGLALEVVGFGPEQHLAHATARATYGQVQHANVDLDSGPLDHVLSTPDLHRWHHSTVYAEGDTNYGAVTSVWDRLFGSFFRPRREFDAGLGVGRMPDFPRTFPALLGVPWRWAAIKRRNARTWYGERDRNPDLHRRS